MEDIIDPLDYISYDLLKILHLNVSVEHQQWVRYRDINSFDCTVYFAGCIAVLLGWTHSKLGRRYILISTTSTLIVDITLVLTTALAWYHSYDLLCDVLTVVDGLVVVVVADVSWINDSAWSHRTFIRRDLLHILNCLLLLLL
jgi:hypothetical protein